MNGEAAYFRGRKVTVAGLARTGLAAANLLQELGAEVTVSDIKAPGELLPYKEKLHPGVKLELGEHSEESFLGAQTVVLSPGVPWDLPLLARARETGTEVISEIEFAARLTDACIIAVTGTNGKSTTTVLIGEMLKAAGKRISVGGNLGHPMVEMVREEGADFLVVEVSSYQLEGVLRFRPHVALMLNLSPDHLERHGDMKGYLEAKKRIYVNMSPGDHLIVNGDSGELDHFGNGCPARRMTFSRMRPVEEGAFLRSGRAMLRRGGVEEEIIPVDEIGIKGAHNQENALAAIAAAAAVGAEPSAMRVALQNFSGLPHRLEQLCALEGVRYVNDSKGTNVGAAVKSLESFQAPVILIAGGRDKGGDYAPLAQAARGKVKAAVLMGETRDKIAAALNGCVETLTAESMAEAVRKARDMAAPGDVVLLSPACSSFDMFTDFEDRGRAFKMAVEELPAGKTTG
jgi:UDP-N-acetylmuramoylalanine--D-glutamate ligase